VFENGKVFQKGKVFEKEKYLKRKSIPKWKVFETLNGFSSRIFFSHSFMFNIDAAKQHGRSPSILISHHNHTINLNLIFHFYFSPSNDNKPYMNI